MENKTIKLREVKNSDRNYFAKWWRDEELLKLTSGVLKSITNQEIDEYFSKILKDKENHHFMIMNNQKTIGHITLEPKKDNWCETKIVIGEKDEQNKGFGTGAIKLIIEKGKKLGFDKIYLEVRPENARAIRAYEKCGFKKAETKEYPENENLPKTLKMNLLM